MIDWLKDNWEKVVSIVVSAAVAIGVFYKRFIRVEDQLAQHLKDDQELKKELKAAVEKVGDMNVRMAEQKAVLDETRDDVRELRSDVKDILKSLTDGATSRRIRRS